MKYTRLEIPKSISNLKIRIIFVFFILIPLISVFAGKIITKLLIPTNQKQESAKSVDELSITVSQNLNYNYEIYMLQAGAFMNKNNADVLKEALTTDDINPVIIRDDDIYRVIIYQSINREQLEEKRDKLESMGYNCLINEFKFTNINGNGSEGTEKNNKFINISALIIKLQLEINDLFNQRDDSKIEAIKKYFEEFTSSYAELKETETAPELETFKSSFQQLYKDYILGYENSDINKCQEVSGQQIILLNKYYEEVMNKIIK